MLFWKENKIVVNTKATQFMTEQIKLGNKITNEITKSFVLSVKNWMHLLNATESTSYSTSYSTNWWFEISFSSNKWVEINSVEKHHVNAKQIALNTF